MEPNALCIMCGKPFHAKRRDAKTCSGRCRKAMSRARLGVQVKAMSAQDFWTWNRNRLDAIERLF